jgi:hypothetical protein
LCRAKVGSRIMVVEETEGPGENHRHVSMNIMM